MFIGLILALCCGVILPFIIVYAWAMHGAVEQTALHHADECHQTSLAAHKIIAEVYAARFNARR